MTPVTEADPSAPTTADPITTGSDRSTISSRLPGSMSVAPAVTVRPAAFWLTSTPMATVSTGPIGA